MRVGSPELNFSKIFNKTKTIGAQRPATAAFFSPHTTILHQESLQDLHSYAARTTSKSVSRLRTVQSLKSDPKLHIRSSILSMSLNRKENISESLKAKYQLIGNNCLKRVNPKSKVSTKAKVCYINQMFPERALERYPPSNYNRYKSYKLHMNRKPICTEIFEPKQASLYVSVIGTRLL